MFEENLKIKKVLTNKPSKNEKSYKQTVNFTLN